MLRLDAMPHCALIVRIKCTRGYAQRKVHGNIIRCATEARHCEPLCKYSFETCVQVSPLPGRNRLMFQEDFNVRFEITFSRMRRIALTLSSVEKNRRRDATTTQAGRISLNFQLEGVRCAICAIIDIDIFGDGCVNKRMRHCRRDLSNVAFECFSDFILRINTSRLDCFHSRV